MPVELDNAVALRKALKQYTPDLAKETQKEIAGHLRKVVNRARGFVPSESPLSGWANPVGEWEYRAFNTGIIKKGFHKALIEDQKQSDVYWLCWEAIRRSGETVKPFGEQFLETLKSVEVLESDPLD